MSTRFEKFHKGLLRFIGWIFEDAPKKKLSWLTYCIVALISFLVFWFFGFFILLVVYAIILWVFAIAMITITLADKIRGGRSTFLKVFKKFVVRKDLDENAVIRTSLDKKEKKPIKEIDKKQGAKTSKFSRDSSVSDDPKVEVESEKQKSSLPGIDTGNDEPIY